jgi:hypothetical protein
MLQKINRTGCAVLNREVEVVRSYTPLKSNIVKENIYIHCEKKVSNFLVPIWNVTDQTLSGREKLNYSRTGRVRLVASRLGTGKSLTFLYSVRLVYRV